MKQTLQKTTFLIRCFVPNNKIHPVKYKLPSFEILNKHLPKTYMKRLS